MRNENVFREVRDILLHCVLPSKREALIARSNECHEIFDRFNISASREDMQLLIGAWTRLLMAMADCGPFIAGRSTRDYRLGVEEPPRAPPLEP